MTTINDQVEELIVRISSGREIGHHIVAGPFLYYPGAGFNRICLVPPNSNSDEDTLFEVVAGDTAKQAKAFYKHFSPEKARQLKELGWNVKSSFHFAWWSKNIFWPDNHKTIQIDDYITFGTWALRESFIRQFERREFDHLVATLLQWKIMDDLDVKKFFDYFKTHKYQTAIVCPSITINLEIPSHVLEGDLAKIEDELNTRKNQLIQIIGTLPEKNKPNKTPIVRKANKPPVREVITGLFVCSLCGREIVENARIKHQREEHSGESVRWQVRV